MLWPLLSGCQGNQIPAPHYVEPAALSQATALTQIENDTIDPAQRQQLQSIASLIDQSELTAARQQLNAIDQDALHSLQQPYQWLNATWYLARKEPWKAISTLQTLGPPPSKNPHMQANYHRLLAQAYVQNNQNLSAIRARIQLETWLSPDAKHANHDAIWQAAQTMTAAQLQEALANTNSPVLAGWLQLAIIAKQAKQVGSPWHQALESWRSTYPNHPGLEMITWSPGYAPRQKIAILLPQTGAMAPIGQAITRGIMMAYYHTQTETASTQLVFIDTAKGNITDLYQQAQTQGADFVIGPLTKAHIRTLTQAKAFKLPTLVLNNINAHIPAHPATVVQFGLSPIDEAQQIANRAWRQGLRRALLIYPDNAWGQEVSTSFTQYWQRLGGQVVNQLGFNKSNQLDTPIKSLLGIDASQARIKAIQNALGTSIQTSPRHRTDVDCVILLTTAEQTQDVYPLLKFYYLGTLPSYALAQANPGYALSPNYYHDLDQINLPTSVWMVAAKQLPSPLPAWHDQLQQTWPPSFKQYPRLYALGVDAYRLALRWPSLITFRGFELQGATGYLSLTPDHHIHRKLQWARIQSNRVTLLKP